MANIANLAVSLIAKTGRFEKGFKRARREVRVFTKSVTRTVGKVAALGLVLTALATGGGTGLLIKQQFSLIDATTKTADKLGILPEVLGGLQFAADQTGNSTQNLELGIQRMTRRVAEAAKGTGEAQGALKELNLDAAALARLTPDQQFLRIADAMEKVIGQSDRVRLGFKLFDSEGVALINTLRGGSAQLERYQREADKLGKTFNRIDAAKVEEANNAFGRLRTLITGAATVAAIQLAPIVQVAANKLTAAGIAGEGMGQRTVNAFNQVLRAMAKTADFIELLKAAWFSFQAVVQGSGFVLIQPLRGFLKMWEKILNIIPGVNLKFTGLADTLSSDFASSVVDSTNKASKALEKYNSGFNSKRAEVFFEKVKIQADKAAKVTAKSFAIPDVSGAASSSSAKQQQFKQIDLRRVFIGGISNNKNSIERESLNVAKSMSNSLVQIVKNTRSSNAAVTA